MQPHNPILETYRTLSGNVRELGQGLLTKPFLLSEAQAESAALTRAKNEWLPVPRLLGVIDETISNLGEFVFAAITDGRLTPDAKAQDIASAANASRAAIDEATTEVQRRVGVILDALRSEAYPARPAPSDATQEARLAGIKGDLRMVWDGLEAGGDLVDAIEGSLRRSIGDNDTLTTWLIASTHWPADYLQSRGASEYAQLLDSRVAVVLDGLAPADLAGARRLYLALADGRKGLPVLSLLFGQLSHVVDDLAQWRPSSYDPTPWSRTA